MLNGLTDEIRVALLHGAGYTGRELIRALLQHPRAALRSVTSRTFAGQPLYAAHPELRGMITQRFSDPTSFVPEDLDAVFVAAEHGQGAHAVSRLLEQHFAGIIIDLSADFRLKSPRSYARWYGREHPAPALLSRFTYGLTEVAAPYDTQWIANPGCFATGIGLALHTLDGILSEYHAMVTALTGASGSGVRPKAATHFPARDGNLRAYKVLAHQHLPEVTQLLSNGARVSFVPVSGPWTRGIWASIFIKTRQKVSADDLTAAYTERFGDEPLIRLYPGALPELKPCVGTPFCDIGWTVNGSDIVVGFALDNLLKGAATQAIQNLNAVFGLPHATGLLP